MKRIAGALLSLIACALTHAQGYPSKPVKLVVSSAAGGSPDLQARIFTQRMTLLYGYVWVIENLPGAGANLAPERVAKAPADGYTLLMASAGPLTSIRLCMRSFPTTSSATSNRSRRCRMCPTSSWCTRACRFTR
jgi:tripartite-type tricarboxylate transporter receptor subunit TctC